MSSEERLLKENNNEYDGLSQQPKEARSLVDQTSMDLLKKQADTLCEHSELLDLAEDMIVLTDMEHRILFWNRAAEHKYGWSRDEIRGEKIHSLLNTTFPQSLTEIEQTLAACNRWNGELVQILRNGSLILVQSQWTIKRDEDGKPLSILEINRDLRQLKRSDIMLQKVNALLQKEITERKRLEQVLKKREKQLKTKAKNLEEINSSLMALLKKKEEKRAELEEKIHSDVKSMVLPYVGKVKKTPLDKTQMNCINIMETYLNEITSPFLNTLASQPLNMTQKEIQVACLIKDGRTTKEIAELMNICKGAVAFHRNSIRKKLGLSKKKVQLASHLSSMA